jgi:cytochrome c oxidase subunit 2
VPVLGIKIDATPGRIGQAACFPLYRGVFYGQCSEICGVNHRFMPVKVEVLSNSELLNFQNL